MIQDAIAKLNALHVRDREFDKIYNHQPSVDQRDRYKIRNNPQTIINLAKRIGLTVSVITSHNYNQNIDSLRKEKKIVRVESKRPRFLSISRIKDKIQIHVDDIYSNEILF